MECLPGQFNLSFCTRSGDPSSQILLKNVVFPKEKFYLPGDRSFAKLIGKLAK